MAELAFIKLTDITVSKRAREDFGDLEGLTASIKEKGILQPITLTTNNVLLAGERRLKAAKAAGLIDIPALIRRVDGEVDALEIELIENVARKDFSWQEECKLVKQIDTHMKEKHGEEEWGQRATAKLLEKSVGSVNRQIQLANYVEAVPQLGEMKTASDAIKGIKKLEEAVIIDELAKRHQDESPTTVTNQVRMADHNYNIMDVFAGLPDLVDTPIGFIECDPPYGIDLQETKKTDSEVNTELDAYNEVDRDDYLGFLARIADGLYEAAGDNCWMVFWFGPTWHHEVKTSLIAAGWKVDDIPGIWNKGTGQTMQPNTNLARTYEPFFICRKGGPILRQQGRANIFTFPPVPGTKKYHPTQRPAALIDEILATFAFPNEIVFVPFLGSGQTLLSAYQASMKGFGYDLSKEYKDRFLVEVAKVYS